MYTLQHADKYLYNSSLIAFEWPIAALQRADVSIKLFQQIKLTFIDRIPNQLRAD